MSLRRLTTRESILAVVTVVVLVLVLLHQAWIRPRYRQWVQLREQLDAKTTRHAMLAGFLDLEDQVKQRIAQLDRRLWQTQSNEATLSGTLQRIEQIAKRHDIGTFNIQHERDLDEHRPSHSLYALSITLAGVLPDVVSFAHGLMRGDDMVVGLRSFSMQAVPGYQKVKCSLAVWVVTCRPVGGRLAQTPP